MSGWRKSSYCDTGSSCVWVDIDGDGVLLADAPLAMGAQCFTHAEWRAFLAGVRNGEFDLPAVQP